MTSHTNVWNARVSRIDLSSISLWGQRLHCSISYDCTVMLNRKWNTRHFFKWSINLNLFFLIEDLWKHLGCFAFETVNPNHALGAALLRVYLTSAATCRSSTSPLLLSLCSSLHPSSVLHQLPQLAPSLHSLSPSAALCFIFSPLWFSGYLCPAPLFSPQ